MMARKFTEAQAHKAWEWFVRQLGIADWEVTLYFQDAPPTWAAPTVDPTTMGMTQTNAAYKCADVWVCPAKHDKEDQISTLFHEGMHVVAADVAIETGERSPTGQTEHLWNKLGDVMAKAYRAGVK